MIKRFSFPSISKETVGEPCSSGTETVGRVTAFPGVSTWRELSSLSPLICFPEPWFLRLFSFLLRDEVRHRAGVNGSNVRSDFSFRERSVFSRVLASWGFPREVPSPFALVAPRFCSSLDVPSAT